MNTTTQERTEAPLVSVIVPVYNTAPWLRQCLDSICAQSYRNLEIICVNDGSTDNSAEILDEYAAKDARIKVIHQANAGLSAARNAALELATGEWVVGVDSDDYLAPDVYERAVACIAPAVDMVFFGVEKVDEEGVILPDSDYFALPAAGEYEMTSELAGKLNVCFCSKLWRRSVLVEHELKFPTGLIYEDEAMFFLYAPYVRKVAICPFSGYYYVQRRDSITNVNAWSDEMRAPHYVSILEFVCQGYACRRMLCSHRRAYLMKLVVKLCSNWYWISNAYGLYCERLYKYGLHRDNYLLESIIPVPWWQRLFISRYSRSKVIRFFGIAVWAYMYSEEGELKSSHCMLWGKLKNICS